MKNLFLLMAIALNMNSLAQDSITTSKIGTYQWKKAVFMQQCNSKGIATKDPEISSEVGQKFNVLRVEGTYAIIQILDYIKDDAPTPRFYKYNFKGDSTKFETLKKAKVPSEEYETLQKYFKVHIAIVEECASSLTKIGGSLAVGVISLPFKYRPQKGNSDFSGVFNLGSGLGYTFSHKQSSRFKHSALIGLSISTISLDSSNTNKNQDLLASTNDFSVFSASLGYMVQYDRIQAGVFFGFDQLGKLNQRQFDWQYQQKPWISVGFGFAIFSKEEPSTSDAQPGQNNN